MGDFCHTQRGEVTRERRTEREAQASPFQRTRDFRDPRPGKWRRTLCWHLYNMAWNHSGWHFTGALLFSPLTDAQENVPYPWGLVEAKHGVSGWQREWCDVPFKHVQSVWKLGVEKYKCRKLIWFRVVWWPLLRAMLSKFKYFICKREEDLHSIQLGDIVLKSRILRGWVLVHSFCIK